MRKWTYLVAALMLGGATATFTGCIDTEEPAGIAELRGAKAALLQAKVQVEAAQVVIMTAQAAWVQAKADYAAQEAKQLELKNLLQEQVNAYKKDSIEREMKINEYEMNKKLYEAQQKAAEAQAAYENALVQIDVALIGYKDNLLAAELQKLLNATYTVSYQKWDDATSSFTTQTVTLTGLSGLSSDLRTQNSNLARMMRELSKLQFSYDISSKIAAVKGQLATEQGILLGKKKTLDAYKVIAGTPYEEWDAQYTELEADSLDLENQKKQLEVAEAEALKPIEAQEKEQLDAATADSELAFAIPEAIQNDFDEVLDDAIVTSTSPSVVTRRIIVFDDWKQTDADGNVTFPNGVKASLNMGEKADTLRYIMEEIEDTWLLDANELAAANVELTQKKAVNDAYWTENTGTYNVDLKAWSDALKAYQTLYNDGNYFSTTLNDRAVVKAAYENLATITDATAQTAATTAFRTQLKDYLTERAKIDGFQINKTGVTPAAPIDPTNDTDWAQWKGLLASADDAYGKDIANGSIDKGGAYKTYVEAAVKIGYGTTTSININPMNNRQVEYTYEEWTADQALSTPTSEVETGSTAALAFTARKDYEDLNSKITNKADWDKLYADLEALKDANQKALDELNLAKAETTAERNKIEADYAAQESAINVQLAGYTDILSKIRAGIKAAAGSTETDYAEILQDLKEKIADLEFGEVDDSGNDYDFTNTSGSIPEQEVVVASYEKLLAALESGDGSYIPAEETAITQKQQEIEDQEAYIAALEAVFKAASDKKDALLAALAAE